MKLYYFIWLLLLVLIMSSMIPRPSEPERFTVDTCPSLNLSFSDEPSCLQMIKQTDGLNEQAILARYGEAGLAFLSSLSTYRFKTPDAEGTYGTGKCIIPNEAKKILSINDECRGVNPEGRIIQLKTVPKTCDELNYGDTEISAMYNGCILERDMLPSFFQYARQALNNGRDDVLAEEIKENKDRYDYNQNLLKQTKETISEREAITIQGDELKRNAETAIDENKRQAGLEKDYSQQRGIEKDTAAQYVRQTASMKEQNDFLYNTSRSDIVYDRVSFTMPQSAMAIYELGPTTMSPWSSWGVNRNFPDQSAKWIWPERYAASSASSRRYYIYKEYNHTGSQPFTANIMTVIDDSGEIYWNNRYLGNLLGTSSNGRYHQHTVTVQPGINLLTYHVRNHGGPAGLLVSVTNSANQVILRTDGSWKWINV